MVSQSLKLAHIDLSAKLDVYRGSLPSVSYTDTVLI